MNEMNKKPKNSIRIESIHNEYEQAVLTLLEQKKECVYGDIIKELRISTSLGQQAIYSLIKKGIIRHKLRSSKLELNVNITR